MRDSDYQSWSGNPVARRQAVRRLRQRDDPLPDDSRPLLPFGNGRSYGDVCLNEDGVLLDCRGLDRWISFDVERGIVRCEAGVLLARVLERSVPAGWFLPVTPGTRFVTLGGAIANDVHGKNHHRAGTFGCHVRCFELLRSDGARLLCSAQNNADYFRATIGGLGLTGLITWAEIQLIPIHSAAVDREVIRFGNLRGFFDLAGESDQSHDYTVAWVDCLAHGAALGRGLFMRGRHAADAPDGLSASPARRFTPPIRPPAALFNPVALRLFNALYYHKQRVMRRAGRVAYGAFFYPLDAVRGWNRWYGRRGFFQYQCALPAARAQDALEELLQRIAASGAGSFLAVLKMFGERRSPGLLSFPLPGATLALDFPNRGTRTLQLLAELDTVTLSAGGRVNPSKDSRMPPDTFRQGFPNWTEFAPFRDERFSSGFWRRVTAEAA